jgi:8-oxo-dGTP pyrophosphatase MutT (NUDIX family)
VEPGSDDEPAGAGPGGDPGAGPGSPGSLRRLIAEHRPVDAREAASKARFLAELDRLARPTDESADPVHATASAIIVGRRGTVLHRHRRLGRWMQPGGHIDRGEGSAAAALREAQEETGLALAHPPGGPRLIHLDVHKAANGHTHLDLRYLLIGPDDDPAPPPGESPDARWCGWDEAESMADEALIGGLRVARALWAGTAGGGAARPAGTVGDGPGGHGEGDAGTDDR